MVLWRVGIDTGGTFTDVVALRDGELRSGKVPSTPPRFEEGVLDAIKHVELSARDVGFLAHGTTATTNATITKTGARTGLLTTRGFRDVLELRRHNRGEIYDVLWDPPEPLVPRQLRLEVSERINYAGDVVTKIDEEEVRAALDRLRDYEIEALAVCFLHSYRNPEHEERVREIVEEEWPELYVSISSALLREPQEFERTSTTVLNSYLGPILSGYVGRLRDQLVADGFTGRLLIMHSGGGLLPVDSAIAVPARTVTSGPAAGAMAAEGFTTSGAPAAGVMAAGQLARVTDHRQIISLDMGGTSADIAVVRDGHAQLINEYVPEFGVPIRFPAVDLLTIGAGGGSIAWVDAAGAPRVGPQSAGAVPGPACYGRGGADPTVTDANLHLGRLASTTRLGGEMVLDAERADEALSGFADKLGLSVTEAALGIIDIANSNMARAIRVMTVERGLDPRDFVLLPFGGAGPMHVCDLAESLSITQALVPTAPGVLSAAGTLAVDVLHDFAQSHIVMLPELDVAEVEEIFQSLERHARQSLDNDNIPREHQRLERSLDLRYVGQIKALSIAVPEGSLKAETFQSAREVFLREYEQRYHHVTEDIEIELAVVRVRGRGVQAKSEPVLQPEGKVRESLPTREVVFRSGRVSAPVYERADLSPGVELLGPLIVEQIDSTTVVPPDWRLSVDKYGHLNLAR